MSQCKLCNSTLNSLRLVKDAKSHETLEVASCEVCGFVQLADLPSSNELKIYYSHNYRSDYKNTYKPKLKYVHRAGTVAAERLRMLLQFVGSTRGKKLLDIGAGGGEFVYQASRVGFSSFGVEPNLGYSEYARDEYGVEVQTSMLDDLSSQSADVVTLFHVFEHLAQPEQAIKKISEILTPEGLLFIEVPNILQNDASPHNIYFKAHLFYYSAATLIAAASQYFEPLEISDDGNLKVIFKKRQMPLSNIQLPDRESVINAQRRMAQKGWFEYLFIGGGLKKPFKRVKQILVESSLGTKSPKELLDSIEVPSRS